MPLIELQSVEVQLANIEVLRGVNLQLEAGERLVVLGPSGAGKTTLLRVLAGLLPPTSGQVTLAGRPLQTIPAHQRGLSWISQDYALYPQLTVRQNLQVPLRQLRLGQAELSQRIDQACQWFEIGGLLERLPSQISGGQAQRVAFAKAIVRRPVLLLLDEPLSQLDFRLREQLLRSVLSAAEQLGITLCWVAHDPWEAFSVATRMVIVDGGTIVQSASPAEVYNRPVSRLAAELTSPWGVDWLPLTATEFAAWSDWAPGGRGLVGVRPEHWRCGWRGQLPAIPVRLDRLQFMGFARLASGRAGATRLHLLDGAGQLRIGDTAELSVDPERLIWL